MTNKNRKRQDNMRVLVQLLTIFSVVQTAESFHAQSVVSSMTMMRTPNHDVSSSSQLFYSRHPHEQQKDPEEMRKEIEAMRQEALHKLHVLQEQIQEIEVQEPVTTAVVEKEDDISIPITSVVKSLETPIPTSGDEVFLDFMEREKAALEETNSNVSGSLSSSSSVEESKDDTAAATVSEKEDDDKLVENFHPQAESLRRLDDTRWRMMLNIGREPGTWMPAEWGASGDRLYLQLELEFSSEALLSGNDKVNNKNFPGDDFLNGRSNTKVLKVVHNEASLSPTLTEGARKVRVQNGGWRVAPYEGPMGTTVLRFYIELEEQITHSGSDVWCPAGRVYCTCGYFPMYHDPETGLVSTGSMPPSVGITTSSSGAPVSLKDALKEEQAEIAAQYDALARANHEDQALLSWDKIKRSSKMMKLKQQATKLAHKRHELNIKEPDKAVLRLSQDQQVGLTREGGVCCKVHKGLAVEYHMLGKFEIASMKNRDHKDYRELLP